MIHVNCLTYTYPGASRPALQDVTLHVDEGEFVLVAGPSGAGKSTLLRCLNGLVPHFSGGVLSGDVAVAGHDPVAEGPRVLSHVVGFVFQDPEAQFVMDRVEDEIAFALENAAVPLHEMRARVEEVLNALGLLPLRDRSLDTLSGGEKQRVAIAAALTLQPRVLVLDEPTSQLDPESAADVLDTLVRLNRDLGLTVILAEHRLERVLSCVDRLVYVPSSDEPVLSGPPREILQQMDLTPPVVALGKALAWTPLPLTVEDAQPFATAARSPNLKTNLKIPVSGGREGVYPPQLVVRDLHFSYSRCNILRGVNLQISPGELVALMGRNGSGKTTLLKCIVGLLQPQCGEVVLASDSLIGRETADICRSVGYLPQEPDALLFAETVADELAITLRNHDLHDNPLNPVKPEPNRADVSESLGTGSTKLATPNRSALLNSNPIRPADLLARLGLSDVAASYPRDLSVGQRQRTALGAVTVTVPDLLLLDEPTRGMDYAAKRALVRLLREWQAEGVCVLLVTHDVELVAQAADRVAILDQGVIVADGPPAEVLTASIENVPQIAPQIVALFPGTGWLTVEDALA